MSRKEASSKAVYAHNNDVDPEFGYPSDEFDCCTEVALAAADAHDAANGVHRIALDDATVERAARAYDPQAWDETAPVFVAFGQSVEDARASRRDHARETSRLVLAAAVKEDG